MKKPTARFQSLNTATTLGLGVVKTSRRGEKKMDVLLLVNRSAAKKVAIGTGVAALVVGGVYAATQL